MTDDKILETIPNIKCIFGCEEAVILAYMPEGCVCFPDDKWQWLCAQHWQSAEPLGSAYAAPDEFLKPIAELKRAAFTAYRAVSDDAKDGGGCFWWEDGGMWESSCGAAYQFTDGGPMDNDHKYCHLCGRHIEIQTDPIDAAMAKESEG